MSSKLSDNDWIESFNEFTRDFYFHRYVAMFKPKSAVSSIVLPSDRHEIKIGLNLLSQKDKNIIKSMEDFTQQVSSLIEIIEQPMIVY
jgi:hypothetical protein